MRVFLSFFVAIVLLTTAGHAQQIYQIRADSVRIYNVCDTAELIIENRTQGTQGFLFNKGAGRTEFRRIRLEKIGDSRIAVTGQDTLDLSTLPGIGGVESIFRNGDSIIYIKKGQQYSIYAPLSNETLRSITDRGSSLIRNIEFQSLRSDSTNGLYWGYNSDLWKIFVESFGDAPAGNLIFESGDNMDEGWIFRCWDYKTPLQKTDVLSLASNRFNYLGKPVWHGGNLNRPMGQHYYSLPTSDGMNADYFAQGTTFAYGGSAPYNGPLLSFGGLNGGYDCQINADYGMGEAISFRVRNGDKHVWSAWRRFIHDGEVATKGANTIIKTEPSGYLGVENWIRVADNTGLYTPTKRYLYNGGPNNWVVRAAEGTSDAVWLALQTGDGAERGSFYANSSNEIGFTNAGTGTWRLRTDAAGNTYATGQVQATSFFQTSLRSLKKDIQPLPYAALPVIKKMQVRSFRFKADSTGKVNVGFIADEVPEEISIPGKGAVDQASTIGLLVKSVQELSAQNEALQQKVARLEALVQQLLNEKK
ncbi:hypothetical protein HHL17_14490 [Chitinophaga sp. G-6-1-13]|uniref:Peptidase S74 domain-containing protein n=1 Tax=Chitinophaga fulva TaxID=2728842 RepID=A0A848GNR0_9BACT|nr:tail fiber domain-containing protein [Chitinophaga fulva]NML38413.1 hypothetical protein [Chitinophaga fulva]